MRCEEITEEEIRQIIREGAHTIDEIKRVTRAGSVYGGKHVL